MSTNAYRIYIEIEWTRGPKGSEIVTDLGELIIGRKYKFGMIPCRASDIRVSVQHNDSDLVGCRMVMIFE